MKIDFTICCPHCSKSISLAVTPVLPEAPPGAGAYWLDSKLHAEGMVVAVDDEGRCLCHGVQVG